MLDKTKTIQKLQASRQYLNRTYGVSSMLLFGSLARDEQRDDSDVDICVEMTPNLFRQAGVKAYLQEFYDFKSVQRKLNLSMTCYYL